MVGQTTYKAYLDWVMLEIAKLWRAIRNAQEMARKAMEDAQRAGQGQGQGNGNTVYAVVTTAVTGRTSTNLGSGFALIDGDYDFTTGAITAGSGTPVKFWTRWSGTKPVGGIVELDFRRGQWFEQGYDCP